MGEIWKQSIVKGNRVHTAAQLTSCAQVILLTEALISPFALRLPECLVYVGANAQHRRVCTPRASSGPDLGNTFQVLSFMSTGSHAGDKMMSNSAKCKEELISSFSQRRYCRDRV